MRPGSVDAQPGPRRPRFHGDSGNGGGEAAERPLRLEGLPRDERHVGGVARQERIYKGDKLPKRRPRRLPPPLARATAWDGSSGRT